MYTAITPTYRRLDPLEVGVSVVGAEAALEADRLGSVRRQEGVPVLLHHAAVELQGGGGAAHPRQRPHLRLDGVMDIARGEVDVQGGVAAPVTLA